MRMRRKSNISSRLEECAPLLVQHPEALRGKWLEEFGYESLHLEIGCGKGRFTVETGQAAPDVLLVALEKNDNVIITALERAVLKNLRNIRFVNRLADDLTAFFSAGEVSRIYINFCDPWPSNRHKKRRLTGSDFLPLYRKVLHAGGEIHFKTDSLPLFEFSLREFETFGFTLLESSYNLQKDCPNRVITDYEQRFCELGHLIYWCKVALCD